MEDRVLRYDQGTGFHIFMKACSFYFMLCVILKLFTEKTDYSLPEGYIIMIIEERLQKQLRRASILVFGIIAVFLYAEACSLPICEE